MPSAERSLGDKPGDFRFLKALRPFSFAVALISCALGLRLAYLDGYQDAGRALLILLAGLLAQTGVNLVNDMGDWHDLKRSESSDALKRVRRNFNLGLLSFGLAGLIALYLIQNTGMDLFWICLLGLIGALGYALPPIDLKSRGLAVVCVFWLMGVLMVLGAYLAMGGGWELKVLLNAVPVSLLVSLLLLSNEIRDYEADRARGLRTLSVRIGLNPARWLYRILVLAALLISAVLYALELLPAPWWLLPSILLLFKPLQWLERPVGERTALPPLTARFLLVFGVLYLFALTP